MLLFEVPVFFFITVMDIFGNFISTDDPMSTVCANVFEISAVIFRMFVAVFLSSWLCWLDDFSLSFSLTSFCRLRRFKLEETDLKKVSTFAFVASFTIS